MIRKICLCLLAAVSLSSVSAEIANPLKTYWGRQSVPLPPTIEVLILHDQPGAVVEVIGKYKITDPHKGALISTRYLGKNKYMQAINDGLKWGEEFPGHHQISLIPMDPQTQIFVDGVEYPGPISIYNIGGTISIVNEVPIEGYLMSVMANKFPLDLPEELLSALAIAERTNAYFQAQNPKSKFWAVDGTLSGYKSVGKNYQPEILKAVRNTRYMVMSKTGAYEGLITPFPLQWDERVKNVGNTSQKAVSALISFNEAEQLAKKGDHAANILEKAFPRTAVQSVNFSDR